MSNNIIDKIQLSGVTYDIGGQGGSGVSVVEVTQAEYDALPSSAKTDTSKMYVITDAEAGDLTNYYTKTETNTLLGGKQATLVSGTNIKTINNESLLGSGNIDIQGGGGGKAIEAGRGISVTTGETADTVSFNLPISAGTGVHSVKENSANLASGLNSHAEGYFTTASNNSAHAEGEQCVASGERSHSEGYKTTASNNSAHAEGGECVASGERSHAEGYKTTASTYNSHTEGYYTVAYNASEHSNGMYNVSNTGSTTADKTLFSVGNGTSNSARHNAFEIRQNGDIYLSSGGTDIKLQDHLGGGGGGGVDVVQTTGTSTTDVMSQDAVTTQLNGKADKTTAARGLGYGNKNTHSVMHLTNQNGQEISGYYYTLSLSKINDKEIVKQGDVNPNTFSLVETSAITTSISSSSTDPQVPSAKAVNDKLGGLSLVKLTQAQYDALATKDSNTLYVIVN